MAETSEIVFDKFDNETSVSYKFVKELSQTNEDFFCPLRFIIIRLVNEYSSEQDYVMEFRNKGFTHLYQLSSQWLKKRNTKLADFYLELYNYNSGISKEDLIFSLYLFVEDENLLEAMNNFYYLLEGFEKKFHSITEIDNHFERWNEELEREVREEIKILETSIIPIQQTINDYDQNPWCKCGPVTIESVKITYRPTWGGKDIQREQGIDIFDRCMVSWEVPYLAYVDGKGKIHTKIFYGEKNEDDPNFIIMLNMINERFRSDHIYFIIILGSGNQKRNYYRGSYSLVKNSFKIETPVTTNINEEIQDTFYPYVASDQKSIEKIRAVFPFLEFESAYETRCKAEFYLFDIKYDETTFLDLLLNSNLYSYFLYIDENTKPYAFKKRLDVQVKSFIGESRTSSKVSGKTYIKNKSLITMNFKPGVTTTTADEILLDQEGKPYSQRLEEGTSYIKIKVTKCRTREELREFMSIFRIIMASLELYLPEYEEIYQDMFPELLNLDPLTGFDMTEERKTRKKNKQDSRAKDTITDLKRQARDIFGGRTYSIKCQGPSHQPTIIPNNRVAEIESQGFETLPIPFYDKPRFHVYCPVYEGKVRYPGPIANDSDNLLYPWAACCYGRSQKNQKNYLRYQQGLRPEEPKGTKTANVIGTDKFLPPAGKGKIHETIQTIIGGDHELQRYGVPRSYNSFLFCLLEAVQNPEYLRILNRHSAADLEEFALSVKSAILENIHIGCMAQEMYDYDEKNLFARFLDPDEFFDPTLFYRALEEYFDVNIYVFILKRHDNVKTISFDLPRHKLFHSRPANLQRNSIFIYKNWGSKSNNLSYPQCELVVKVSADDITAYFGTLETQNVHYAFQEYSKVTVWNVDSEGIQAFTDLYSTVNLVKILYTRPLSQYIDRFGKLRGLTFDHDSGPVTIVCFPGQSQNIPISSNIYLTTYEVVKSLFPRNISGYDKSAEGEIVGIWLKILDVDFGLYIPIIPILLADAPVELMELPEGGPNSLVKVGKSFTNRLRILRRVTYLVVFLIRWLYDYFRLERGKELFDFYSRLEIDDYDQDSLGYYDLRRIKRELPIFKNFDEAMRYLEQVCPTLVKNGKIQCYNQSFAESIQHSIRDYDHYSREPFSPEDINYTIDNFYQTADDFIQYPNTKIFFTIRDFDFWVNTLRNTGKTNQVYHIRTTITPAMSKTKEPFLYQDSRGFIYLIQNVAQGSKQRALKVGETWLFDLRNSGYETGPSDLEYVHFVYSIEKDYHITVAEDFTKGRTPALELLYYGSADDYRQNRSNDYAAMLRIL